MNSQSPKFALYPLLIFLLWPWGKVSAQLIPDRTLGAENSTVNQLNQLKQLIEGGAVRGENLFHSFLEFNVAEGRSVYFANPSGVNNILTRVTGENISQILGTLGVNGNAHLFLLNPHGFIFGANATLDLNGSFTATTGDIQLGEDGVFSATDISGSSLLNVKPEALFSNALQNQIENQANLTVPQGQHITLIADKVLTRGNLTAPQLQPDTTLGTENSQIETIDENNYRVIGGARRGANLFHSFLEFNIETGKRVYFANRLGIENILARVTGNNISQIRGRLGVEGSADLYFLNPHGLFFNSDASLDLNGSFFASSAEAIAFNDFEYSAVNPNLPANLKVSLPTGLRFGANSGDIINQGTLITPQDLSLEAGNLDLLGIVSAGGNLTLKARDTVKIRDSQETPFMAAGQNLLIQGHQTIDISALNHPESGLWAGKEMILRSANPVVGDAHYWVGGSFSIENLEGKLGNFRSVYGPVIRSGGDVSFNVYEGASLHIIAGGPVKVGTITVTLTETGRKGTDFLRETIQLSDGTLVDIDGSLQPTVDIRAGVSLNAVGNSGIKGINFDPTLTATSADLNIGDILIDANNGLVLLTNQYQPNKSLAGGEIKVIDGIDVRGNGGDAGQVFLDARSNITLNGHILATSDRSRGGDILLNSLGDVRMINGTEVNMMGAGGGNITINTKNLQLTEASQIRAGINDGLRNLGAKGGKIEIKARGDVILEDGSLMANTLNSEARGSTGEINLNTQSLTLKNGAVISSSTGGRGNAGQISITARDGIILDGSDSGIISKVEETGIGNSEGIVVETSSLDLTNGAVISGATLGRGDVGQIKITASEGITADGGTSLGFRRGIISQVEETGIGNSEGIAIETTSLSLINGARIDATSLGKGDAGEISITASDRLTADSEVGQRWDPKRGVNSGIFSGIEQTGMGKSTRIEIKTSSLSLKNGAAIVVTTLGQGDAGEISITARDAITVDGYAGEGFIAGGLNSGIYSAIGSLTQGDLAETARGNSEGIEINTNSLSLTNGGLISTTILGQGDAGQIAITANSITVDGQDSQGIVSGIFSGVTPTGRGNSGGIEIDTHSLSLTNGGEILASTFGQGNAGQISITASESIIVDGESSGGLVSGIISEIGETRAPNIGRLLFAEELDTRGTTVGNSEGIVINTSRLSLANGAVISSSTGGRGNAGQIRITATEGITLDGQSRGGIGTGVYSAVEDTAVGNSRGIEIDTNSLSLTNGGEILASTLGKGDAGQISITAGDRLTVDGNSDRGLIARGLNSGIYSAIGSLTQGDLAETVRGNSEGIEINTNSLSLTNGGLISTTILGQGDAGQIRISANTITVDGQDSQGIVSGIFSGVTSTGKGNSGGIEIDTHSLSLTNGGEILASTLGQGNAGQIRISASETLTIDGESSRGLVSGIISEIGRAGLPNIGTFLFAEELGTPVGNSEGIVINTSDLYLTNGGEISSSTGGRGNAGNINLTANSLFLTNESLISAQTVGLGRGGSININLGKQLNLNNNSQITASTTENSQGNSGSIIINSPVINLEDNSLIIVSSQGIGEGGDITVNSNRLNLDESSISAETAVTQGGNINLDIRQLLTLSQSSSISATGGTAFAGGDGGNIIITTPFTIAFPSTLNSSITANAFEGNGGNINITTNAIFGGQFLIIDASSQFGLDGEVIINSPEVEPTGGLVEISANFIDAESLIAKNACALSADKIAAGSSFVIKGKGGLPATPEESGSDSHWLLEWQNPEISEQQSKTKKEAVIVRERTEKEEIVWQQAQGWLVNSEGKIILTATPTTKINSPTPYFIHPSCSNSPPESANIINY
jgi:filamentous hemagglutinin family protein